MGASAQLGLSRREHGVGGEGWICDILPFSTLWKRQVKTPRLGMVVLGALNPEAQPVPPLW